MKFGIYLPETTDSKKKLPVLFYLSGLTCTEANFIDKSGFQRFASQYQMIVVNPDTSPRGVDIPGDSDSWDFGKGAGFYLDATESPWSQHYRMFSYVTDELPKLIEQHFPQTDFKRQGIFGHSMGGHGALICALKIPNRFLSVSAFAPIVNPIACQWGQKAFKGYLGEKDQNSWKHYDACELAKTYNGPAMKLLVDQGEADKFLAEQLLTKNLEQVIAKNDKISAQINMRPGYDHSYLFISTFMGDHFHFHAANLNAEVVKP